MKLFTHQASGRFSVPRVLLMVFGGLILAATLALLFGWGVWRCVRSLRSPDGRTSK